MNTHSISLQRVLEKLRFFTVPRILTLGVSSTMPEPKTQLEDILRQGVAVLGFACWGGSRNDDREKQEPPKDAFGFTHREPPVNADANAPFASRVTATAPSSS